MSDFRHRLIAARERLGLPRREMAALLLTPHRTYQRWEDGSRRVPGVVAVAAEALMRPDPAYASIVAAAAALSLVGASQSAIARKLGISRGLVVNMVARGEIPATRGKPSGGGRKFDAADHQRANDLLVSGRSIAETADMIGCSPGLIKKWVKAGIVSPSKYRQGETGRPPGYRRPQRRRSKRVAMLTEEAR